MSELEHGTGCQCQCQSESPSLHLVQQIELEICYTFSRPQETSYWVMIKGRIDDLNGRISPRLQLHKSWQYPGTRYPGRVPGYWSYSTARPRLRRHVYQHEVGTRMLFHPQLLMVCAAATGLGATIKRQTTPRHGLRSSR
eukprot:3265497-Rhodomonas_salina.3